MPRSRRIEFEGAVYHVMARGNRRGDIFLDDDDRRTFLRTLGEACRRTGMVVCAWVLMRNHYHLALQTPRGNLVEGMGWLKNTYTRRFNRRLDAQITAEKAGECGLANLGGQGLQSTLRRGCYWGRQAFREALLDRLGSGGQATSNANFAASEQARDNDESRGSRILELGCEHFRIEGGAGALRAEGRGSVARRSIAWALSRRTGLRQARIADLVGYRTAVNVSQQARAFEQRMGGGTSDPSEREWISKI